MKKDSLAKNFVFQFFYQVIVLVLPLVLSPYLTRVLQESSLGIYSYVHSISYYFVLFANLGISRHGQRVIAQKRDDVEALRKTFWSLYSLHVIVSLIAVMAYLIFIKIFIKENALVYYIDTFFVLSALFDITWLFYGLENFQSVVTKNLIVKIAHCALIFFFVHKKEDLLIYTSICALSVLVGQVVMIPQAVKLIKPCKFTLKDCRVHIKPLLIFSIAIVASTLYTTFDMTLLGVMTNKENVAFYSYANQIISVPNMLISVIGTVMFPMACRLAAEGNISEQNKSIKISVSITSIMGFAFIFGILAVAKPFAIIYYGESFAICGSIMMALSPLIFIIGLGSIIRTQFMIPNGMDKQFTVCIVLNAIVNIILSVILIPSLGIYGAVMGTLSAETFGLVFQSFLCRKFLHFRDIISRSIPYAIIGGIMFAIIRITSDFINQDAIGLISQIILGAVIYCALALGYCLLFDKDMKTILISVLSSVKGKVRVHK